MCNQQSRQFGALNTIISIHKDGSFVSNRKTFIKRYSVYLILWVFNAFYFPIFALYVQINKSKHYFKITVFFEIEVIFESTVKSELTTTSE
jgi:hypothetical protein